MSSPSLSFPDLLCFPALSRSTFSSACLPVALYAISAVYFAGVMVRLMLTLTPVVCMLSAVAFSSVFEHYMGDDTKREKPPAEDSSDEDDKRNSGNLYDKVNLRVWSNKAASSHARFVGFGSIGCMFISFPHHSPPVWINCDSTVIQLQRF